MTTLKHIQNRDVDCGEGVGKGAPSPPSDGGEGRGEEARLDCPSPRSSPHSFVAGRGRRGAHCIWLLLLSVGLLELRADFASTEFERANKLYEQSKFADAVAAYDNLIADGKTSAAVFFNRGNAFFKQNQIGKAIESYRRAAQLSPRDPEVRANLQFARNQVGGATLTSGRLKNWLHRLTVNEWTGLAALVFWLLFALLAVVQWRTELKRPLKRFIFALTGILVLLAIPLTLSLRDFYSTQIAIVTAREAAVRNGPVVDQTIVFSVRDGAELEVLDHNQDWLQVSDGKHLSGWVKRDAVLIFEPSAKAKIKS